MPPAERSKALCRNETVRRLSVRILSASSQSKNEHQTFSIAANGKIRINLSKAFDACELNQAQAIVIKDDVTNFNEWTVRDAAVKIYAHGESEEEEQKSKFARYRVAKKEIYAFPLRVRHA